MYVFMVIIVVKLVVSRYELFKCVYLASMGVKIEHTVGVQNKDFFQNAYLMVMSTETLAATKVKISKIYALVRRNLMIYMEN